MLAEQGKISKRRGGGGTNAFGQSQSSCGKSRWRVDVGAAVPQILLGNPDNVDEESNDDCNHSSSNNKGHPRKSNHRQAWGKIRLCLTALLWMCFAFGIYQFTTLAISGRSNKKDDSNQPMMVQTPAFDSTKLQAIRSTKQRLQQQEHEQHPPPLSIITMSSPPPQPTFLYDLPLSPTISRVQRHKGRGRPYCTLPPWIAKYVRWHHQQRQEYPGMELFNNPNAPKLLVRTCLGLCGGLHDRLGQLPWDLYLAQKTNRVLLMAWQRPKELEHFLVPNTNLAGVSDGDNSQSLIFDWRVPQEAHFGFKDIRAVRNITQLFEGYPEDRPDEYFWNVQMDKAVARATGNGSFAHMKILRHRLLGHLNERALEERLANENFYVDTDARGAREDDALSDKVINAVPQVHHEKNLHAHPTFGNIFHLFFRPSQAIQLEINKVLQSLQLQLYDYTAVHCRVRHPKAHPAGKDIKGKNANYPADKTGLPWQPGNPLRQFALETAQHALQCAVNTDVMGDNNRSNSTDGKIYFLADSNDLVRHVTEELQNATYVEQNQFNTSLVYHPLLQTIQEYNNRHHKDGIRDRRTKSNHIVARDVTLETAHIDRQKGRDPPAYFATFVDLYVAMHAKCVVYGIGYYAAFAAKLSGVDCTYLYAQESWGSQVSKQAKICPNTADSSADVTVITART